MDQVQYQQRGFFYNQGRLIEMVKEESRRENNCSDFKIL